MGSIERRIQRLEDLYYCTTATADLEERRRCTEELRERLIAKMQRMLDEAEERRRRAGLPPRDEVLTPEDRARAHQHFKQALRRKAGLE